MMWKQIAVALLLLGCGASAPCEVSNKGPVEAPPPQEAASLVALDEALELVPVVFYEIVEKGDDGKRPLLRKVAADDPRVPQCTEFLDNEAARFSRRLIAVAQRKLAPNAPVTPLPIALKKGGNFARTGYRLVTEKGIEDRETSPYVVLECDAQRLSATLLHETGHILHTLASRGKRSEPPWTAALHSTFAVTDPITALAEGIAIHLETVWGHYGRDRERRAYYHRLAPHFGETGSTSGEFYAPIRDLQTFSQSFARYSAVRDALPGFAGHFFAGDYLRSQYDPSRDLSALKRPNAYIATEGAVASVMFWIVVGAAGPGAQPGGGLDQPQLLEAESRFIDALMALPAPRVSEFRPDVVDFVTAYAQLGAPERELAVTRFLDLSRAITVRPRIIALWPKVFRGALSIDEAQTLEALREIEKLRSEAHADVARSLDALRAGLGPVVPARVEGVSLHLVGFGEPFPMEIDLNAAGAIEWATLKKMTPKQRERVASELDERPFSSLSDFENRLSVSLEKIGLSKVELPPE